MMFHIFRGAYWIHNLFVFELQFKNGGSIRLIVFNFSILEHRDFALPFNGKQKSNKISLLYYNIIIF